MTRVLAIDLGKQLGWALLGGKKVLSGSRSVVKRWAPLGESLITLDGHIQTLIRTNRPQYLAVARPFVRLDRDEDDPARKYNDTAQNLVPMFACYAVLHIVGARNGIPVEVIEEGRARSIMLGEFLPMGSDATKKAVMQACRDRGWPVCDDHAGDALCVGAAVLERLEPSKAHLTTPLFIATAQSPRRAKEQA